MNSTSPQSNSSSIDTIFGQLNQRDVEEFNTGYHGWNLRQQISALQFRIGNLHQQIAENAQRMQEVQPSAIALATLARLQSNGVNDIDLLDRMLEQGELWLDRTMQRLEYFEQLNDFISDDYTQWCQLALEGAYDWIDSMLDGSPPSSSAVEASSKEEELTEATEELFLQKLSSDEIEDESSRLETTLKRPAITTAHPSEPLPPSEDISIAQEIAPLVEEASPAQEENFLEDVTPASPLPVEADLTQEHGEADVTQAPGKVLPFEEPISEEEVATPGTEQSVIQEYNSPNSSDDTLDEIVEKPPLQENITPEVQLSVESSSISGGEQPSMQEFVEIPVAIEDSPSSQLETLQQREEHPASEVTSPGSMEIEVHLLSSGPGTHEQHQKNETPKRPNVIRRFIGRIWKSQP